MREGRAVSPLWDNAILTASLQGFSLPGFFAWSVSLTFAQNTVQIILPSVQIFLFFSLLQGEVQAFSQDLPSVFKLQSYQTQL